ncbi:MAG: hypothetical protein Kow0069_06300 [Promethearchaeota archaeon]
MVRPLRCAVMVATFLACVSTGLATPAPATASFPRLSSASDSPPLVAVPEPNAQTFLLVDLPRAWGRGALGTNVTIAVVDTGINVNHLAFGGSGGNYGHLDFSRKVVGWHDVYGNLSEPADVAAHGSHVASIAAGNYTTPDGSPAYWGAAPSAHLVVVRAFVSVGFKLTASGERVVSGLDWLASHASEYRLRVASLSFVNKVGPTNGTDSLSLAVERLVEAGVLVVAAAGNEGPAPGSVKVPAASKSALAVGFVDAEGTLHPDSSRGPTDDGRQKPEVLAPGVEVTGARAFNNETFYNLTGSSMAAPIVAGVAALLFQQAPWLSPLEAKAILAATAWQPHVVGSLVDEATGYGVVQASAALDAATKLVPWNETATGLLTGRVGWELPRVAAWRVRLNEGEAREYQLVVSPGLRADLHVFGPRPDALGLPTLVATTAGKFLSRCRVVPKETGDYLFVVKARPGSFDGYFWVGLADDWPVWAFVALATTQVAACACAAVAATHGRRHRRGATSRLPSSWPPPTSP